MVTCSRNVSAALQAGTLLHDCSLSVLRMLTMANEQVSCFKSCNGCVKAGHISDVSLSSKLHGSQL